MPKVGSGNNAKHFPYTPGGMMAAEYMAKKTGMPVKKAVPAKKKAGKK